MKIPNSTFLGKNTAGSSIISVLVSLSLLGIIGAFYFGSSVRNLKTTKNIESRDRFSALETAYANELIDKLRKVSGSHCHSATELKAIPFGYGNSSATLSFASDIPTNHDNPNAAVTASLNRCRKPSFISPAESGSEAHPHLHFCVTLDEPSSGSTNKSFIETAIDFESTSSTKPASCAQFASDPSVVAKLYYSIFLFDRAGDHPSYVKKSGMTIIAGGAQK